MSVPIAEIIKCDAGLASYGTTFVTKFRIGQPVQKFKVVQTHTHTHTHKHTHTQTHTQTHTTHTHTPHTHITHTHTHTHHTHTHTTHTHHIHTHQYKPNNTICSHTTEPNTTMYFN